jgi:hypothetical protein
MQANTKGSRQLSTQFNVSSRQIRYWCLVFRLHGEDAFLHKQKPYTKEARLEMIVTVTATTPRHVFADGLIYHHVSTNEVIYESYPSQPCSVA